MRPPRRIRHIHIESGPLALDFQGSADQIHSVAAELAATAHLEVTVDDDVRPSTPVLPCGGLWEYPDPAGQSVKWPPTGRLTHRDSMPRRLRDW
ncbi:hypothetical protein ACIHDR_43255 [Nocardia sp. NPDC052278]|uniref:hypothetical protein n=1 Tax=unclassified Nocardia TaxID=2637762 RepID=UPI0036B01F1F